MFVIEVMNPDGPHWFGGIVRNEAAFKAGHDLPMNLWSPYKEDAKMYDSEEAAQVDLDKLKDVPSAQIVQHWKAKFNDSRRLDKDRPNACVMRAKYLQEGEVFVMTNTYYIVTSRNAEDIHYGYADLAGIYKGGNSSNGPAGIMSANNAYWVSNMGHKSILHKSKTENA